MLKKSFIRADIIHTARKSKKWPLLSLLGLLISGCTIEGPERLIYVKEGEVVVQRGDTISSIAARHRVSVKALVECNRLSPPYSLNHVKKLILPSAGWHTPTPFPAVNPVLLKEKEEVQWTTVDEDSSYTSEKPILLADSDTDMDSELEDTLVQNPKEWEEEKKEKPKKIEKKPVHAGWGAQEEIVNKTKQKQIKEKTKIQAKEKAKEKIKKIRFCRPVSGSITKKFQKNKHGAPSTGIRFKAPKGTPIRATADGIVVMSGKMKGEPGKAVVLIKHSDGWSSFYKLLSSASVSKNAEIKQGEVLGISEGPELIFELRDQRAPVDPEKYLK